MKRFFLYSFLIAAIGLIVWTVFQLKNRHIEPYPISQMIPREVDMIMEIRNAQAAHELLMSLPGAKQTHWNDGFETFFEYLQQEENNIQGNSYFCIKQAGAQWMAIMARTSPPKELSGEATSYKGYSIVQVNEIYCLQENEYTIMSNALALVQSAVDTERVHPLLLKIANDAAGDVAFSVYSSWENGDQMLIEPQRIGNERMLSGVIIPSDSSLSRWKGFPVRPFPSGILEIPASAKSLEVRDYSNASDIVQHIDAQRKNTNEDYFWNQSWNAISDSCQCSVYEIAVSWQGPQRAGFVVGTDSTDAVVSAFSIADSVQLSELFAPVMAPLGNINKVNYPEVFRRYQDDLFLCNYSYAWYSSKAVYFSDSPEALEKVRAELTTNNTFQYQGFRGEEMGGITLFGGRYLTALFPETLTWLFMNSEKGYGTIKRTDTEHYLFQWYLSNLNTSIPDLPVSEPQADSSNTSASETMESNDVRSWLLTNHIDGKKERLELSENTLSQINEGGQKNWSVELNHPIIGEIQQVDLFKNGKLQYAFTTREAFYIIDRNGKNVKGFPIQYKSEITSGLCIADYDNNKNYRFFIATSDGKIYNLTNEGQSTPGWQYSPSEVVTEVQVRREQNQSHLVVRYKNGGEKKLKRNGTPW